MELELKRGGRTARVETLGGELVPTGTSGAGVHLGGRSGLLAGAQSLLFHCGDAEGGKDPL